jgi:hypothetical protein
MTSYLPTSYFSEPAQELDPKLFEGRSLRSQIRQGIVSILHDFLHRSYRHADLWVHPYLAGSGVSYQWSADRMPGDLDCLMSVDFVQFRKANPEFRGLSDKEIADQLNEDFREKLQPTTENWNGFELTFFAITSSNIRSIKPYAAYDLKYNEWAVTPNPAQAAPTVSEWDSVAQADNHLASQTYTRATKAMQDLQLAQGGPQKRNAEVALHIAFQQAEALYNDIHEGRSEAFSPKGEGYADFHNYRWQAGKRSGTIDLLKDIKASSQTYSSNESIYGVPLPDASTLIRRAALYGRM